MPGAAPVASLPMYDWPEIAWANDDLWAAIAPRLVEAGIPAPASLDRSSAYDSLWRDPGLVLSQTCGFPFSTRLRGQVRLVGTPNYDVPGWEGPNYCSMIVVRAEERAHGLRDVKGGKFIFNTSDSLSGYVAFGELLKEAGVDPRATEWIESGSHRASVLAVAGGVADAAAIDALCWAFTQQYEAEVAKRLKVIARTPLRPAPPYITALERTDREIRAIRQAIHDAIADPATQEARQALHLTGMSILDEWHYGPIARLAS